MTWVALILGVWILAAAGGLVLWGWLMARARAVEDADGRPR